VIPAVSQRKAGGPVDGIGLNNLCDVRGRFGAHLPLARCRSSCRPPAGEFRRSTLATIPPITASLTAASSRRCPLPHSPLSQSSGGGGRGRPIKLAPPFCSASRTPRKELYRRFPAPEMDGPASVERRMSEWCGQSCAALPRTAGSRRPTGSGGIQGNDPQPTGCMGSKDHADPRLGGECWCGRARA
jgi:hypothetical protein